MHRLEVLSRQLSAGNTPLASGSGPQAPDRPPLVQSRADYERLYAASIEDPNAFWLQMARDYHWEVEPKPRHIYANTDVRNGHVQVSFFEGGRTNLCYNALDRWIEAGRGDQKCFLMDGNDIGHEKDMTYSKVLMEVCRVANWLRAQGVRKGDAVTLYLPQTCELPIAMLACARIGAVHSVVFAGFSAESLAQRILDCDARVVITATGCTRGSKVLHLKRLVDSALVLVAREREREREKVAAAAAKAGAAVARAAAAAAANAGAGSMLPAMQQQQQQQQGLSMGLASAGVPEPETDAGRASPSARPMRVLVYEKSAVPKEDTPWTPVRDAWWREEIPLRPTWLVPEWLGAEERAFLLYTSGSTGRPKGVVHTVGGFMVGAGTTCKYLFDLRPGDIYWCTADCGWITGHSYLAYGPLLCGATCVLFGATPSHPNPGRCWRIIDKYKVRTFYTAPTLLRSLLIHGDEWVLQHDRSSLRLLGSVGEPINEAAWHWLHAVIGGGRCPVIDTWWQTETGMVLLSPWPGQWCPQVAGAAGLPFFGVQPVLLDPASGAQIEGEGEGVLCLKGVWPAMARTLHGDHDRYEETYFKPFPGYYFTGDGARRDAAGLYHITGRVDDVINVSGHRIGTAEVEGALTEHEDCAEAAVIGVDHPVKGSAIYAYVTLRDGAPATATTRAALNEHVRKAIGPFAVPDVIHWAPALPKTRSGKIMRRVLRKIASGHEHELGDVSTLAEPGVVEVLLATRGK